MKYNYEKIKEIFQKNADEAFRHLIALEVYCKNDITIKGLKGWIFEQTIQYCLRQELGKGYEFKEQVKVGTKRPDLSINDKVIIEIKTFGLFSYDSVNGYKELKDLVESEGKTYLYITLEENIRHREKTTDQLGDSAFFLSVGQVEVEGEWERFINRIKEVR